MDYINHLFIHLFFKVSVLMSICDHLSMYSEYYSLKSYCCCYKLLFLLLFYFNDKERKCVVPDKAGKHANKPVDPATGQRLKPDVKSGDINSPQWR